MNDIPDTPETFEDALEQLETIVDQIESGQISLEASIARYEEGTKLIKHCRGILDQAEKKIQLLTENSGELTVEGDLEPMDAADEE